jgi:hypothetical protein
MGSNYLSHKVIFLALLLTHTATWTTPADDAIDGEYFHRTRQCDGTLNPTDCISTEEGFSVKRRNANTYYLYARTHNGSIFHSCTYQGLATMKNGKLLSGRRGFCEVTVSFRGGEAFLSSEGEGCRDFCSANASLAASNLRKKSR